MPMQLMKWWRKVLPAWPLLLLPSLLAAQLEAQWSGAQVTQMEQARQALETVAAALDTPPEPASGASGNAAQASAPV